MDASSSHPSDQTLDAYSLGKLDAAPAERIHRHLDACETCRRRVAELSGDSFLGRVRDAQSPPVETINHKSTPAPVAADTLPPGLADHPDYTVKRELGRGGMGVVYLAHNELMGRDEVLKVMGRHIIERPGVLERFLREIRAVAKLRHPNIVAAYSASRVGDSIVFAMEYVEGLDLAKMVKSKGPMPIAHACLFAHQAALGLQHAHEAGLVHRDVKPANLMLSRVGSKASVKVLDFGLAKATREEKIEGGLTSVGQALGTPDFIAPEQIMDAQSADIRADIYSLGATLYYLLTGRPPFRGASLYDIYQAHISRDADPLNVIRPEVPSELAALVAKMMAKEPGRRFQTPGEVADGLAPFFKKSQSGTSRQGSDLSRVVDVPIPPSSPPQPRSPRPRTLVDTSTPGKVDSIALPRPDNTSADSGLVSSGHTEGPVEPIGKGARVRGEWKERILMAVVGLLALVAALGILKVQFKGGSAVSPEAMGRKSIDNVSVPAPSKLAEKPADRPPADPGRTAARRKLDLKLNQKVVDKLERVVPMSFATETPLEDVLKYIASTSRGTDGWEIPIYVDPVGLQEAEKSESTPVKFDQVDLPLKTSLRLILQQLGLTYVVKGGILYITSSEIRDTSIKSLEPPKTPDADNSPKSALILDELEKLVEMPFSQETPLEDVLKYLKSTTTGKGLPNGITIYLDPAGLSEAEKSESTPVKINLSNVPLKYTLGLTLAQLGLDYCVKEGMIVISTEAGVARELGIKPPPEPGGGGFR